MLVDVRDKARWRAVVQRGVYNIDEAVTSLDSANKRYRLAFQEGGILN